LASHQDNSRSDVSSRKRGEKTASARASSVRRGNGAAREEGLRTLLGSIRDLQEGDFSVRMPPRDDPLLDEIAEAFNQVADRNQRLAAEVVRVSRVVGSEGQMADRASLPGASGEWIVTVDSVNSLITDLVQPTTEVARVLSAVAHGDLSQKMVLEIEGKSVQGEFLRIGATVNTMVDQLKSFASEVTRVAREVGTEGQLGGQAEVPGVAGTWKDLTDSVNSMASNLTAQVRNIADVTTAVARGDLSRKITVDVQGEIQELKETINTMVDQLGAFASEVTRVAREVGTEGKLGVQARVPGVAGTWKDLTDNVNAMAGNLTVQLRDVSAVATAVASGDLTRKITVEVQGEILQIKDVINAMVDQLSVFADEVTRVAREVGTEGQLGGQAEVPGVAGTWQDLTDNVNAMAGNLTVQLRDVSGVATAIANGDLTQKITVEVSGEILQIKDTINTMVDQLSVFASEVTRVAREVGTEGELGGQAEVPNVAGTWKDLTDNVNSMASNLTAQVRNIADVTTAVARGDLSRKITVDVRGEIQELKETINTMVDQLSVFASEVTRVAREVGTEGELGGQAEVPGVAGTWKDLTDNVNAMAENLTDQVRNIALVTTAVANGDLSQKITVDVAGEVRELKDTINSMVDRLSVFADEVTRVAREVGTEGELGGQAEVPNLAGTWKGLTENVNSMAGNLTAQVRNIADVTTAVARGDLSRKITVDVKGEMLELKDTINAMVDSLRIFADEVTRVAREVGTEGKLGGQAEVPGVAGTWKDLTENVNQLANNLTVQVRAIADVAAAVTKGDLTRTITVEAQGEVDELKSSLNQMIGNLKATTEKNTEQDWLKTNLAKFSRMMQGQKDLESVSRLIMSELTPLVSARHGAFFIVAGDDNEEPVLQLIAAYAFRARKHVANRFHFGEGLVGQAALEREPILLTNVPDDYIQINSALGEATPRNIVVLPILFEGEVKAVIELASFGPFSAIHLLFLDQLSESVGVVLNMIGANMRTEELLQQSQSLTQELQSQSEALQTQQQELKNSNAELEEQARSLKTSEELLKEQQEELQQVNEELEEKASLLAEQNRRVEQKNAEVESARLALEEKAEQLAISSKYKSEFLANMSHELRTPLNSLLILARLLAENPDENLTPKQVEYAETILASGSDLLGLISDVLDLSKVEAGKMALAAGEVEVAALTEHVERSFRPLAEEKGLHFKLETDPAVSSVIRTDRQRLEQVLKNLLSNALKFTAQGEVAVAVKRVDPEQRFANRTLDNAEEVIAFEVADTGIGIASDKLRLIFEAFQQEDGTTSRRFGGTGLGLSISREITRLLGGEIQVESTPDEGSVFTLYLPAVYTAPPPEEERLGEGGATLESEFLPAPIPAIPDDREIVQPHDRVVLIVENDLRFAEVLLEIARERGFRGVVARDGESALRLVRQHRPDAITLDIKLPGIDGWEVLDRLKRSSATRHIPVHVVSGHEGRQRGLKSGAVSYLEKPVSREALGAAFQEIGQWAEHGARRLLVVEDDAVQRQSIVELVAGDDVEITTVESAEDALAALSNSRYDCVVLDLGLADMDGFEFLEQVKSSAQFAELPIIVYTGHTLSPAEETRLQRYAETIILKDAKSPERLLDETALFLHRVENRLPNEKRRMLEQLHRTDEAFAGKRILVVDDDVRNVFSLTSVFEQQGMEVQFAENGRQALDALAEGAGMDLVLMDLMMPEMDGYEAIRAIRKQPAFHSLPIITLTAKAMKGEREKSIAAGASDYLTKPVDVDQLLSLMRVWLYR
jgi:CheY-like chemotaxis protein/HAMP domain-containing protein/signal transduction histidine kinase